MAPVRNYSNWNQRSSDFQEQVEPYQKFFFICEGANTEVFYFRKLIDLRKQLGIHPLIDLPKLYVSLQTAHAFLAVINAQNEKSAKSALITRIFLKPNDRSTACFYLPLILTPLPHLKIPMSVGM